MPSPRERLISKRAKLTRLAEDPAATEFEAVATRERIARIDVQLAQFAEEPVARPAPEAARVEFAWGWMHVVVVRSDAYGHETWNWTPTTGTAA